ncbi:MAG: hypothetical protein JXB29_09260 [Sedimentisphaerales bacterium]|nr:hypothetical protein [Sedimentisphaerales bacterium]
MKFTTRLTLISAELKSHAPFTLLGALSGIACMLLFRNAEYHIIHRLFYIFHPAHVVLSAMVTASIFKLHTRKKNFLLVLVVGYLGSIVIATLSDSIIPYLAETLLGMEAHKHIGFIEEWYIVNPAALAGIFIACFWPKTKFPHAGHVLLSTWASSFHMIMAMAGQISVWIITVSFVFLFLAVWLPCCISDIVFPLLFVKPSKDD